MPVKTVEITESYKLPDLLSKVQKGVELLDAKVPGWEKKVDTKTLDLCSAHSCVVGQLAIKAMLNGPLEDYHEGIRKLFTDKQINNGAGVKHGFELGAEFVKEVRAWLEKQPPTHPWWPFLHGPMNGIDYSSTDAVENILWDYLTAIWAQVIKSRLKAQRASRRSTR